MSRIYKLFLYVLVNDQISREIFIKNYINRITGICVMNNNGVLSFSALVTLILGLIFLLAALQFIFGIFGDVERKIDVDEVDDLATDSETITMHLSSEVTASRVDDTVISVNSAKEPGIPWWTARALPKNLK